LDKHKTTKKHQKNGLKANVANCPKCAKQFKSPSGVWKHLKSCDADELVARILDDNKGLKEIIVKQLEAQNTLMEHIQAQHTQLTEMLPKLGGTTVNLNFFLNEQCKDAVNWEDFLDTLRFDCVDGKSLTDNMVRTICKGMAELGLYKRPIHCLAQQLMIKSEDVWVKDAAKTETALRNTTTRMQQRYAHVIKTWEEQNPNWFEDVELTAVYTKLVSYIMSEVDEAKCAKEILKNADIGTMVSS
jgi:hypothetical protein